MKIGPSFYGCEDEIHVLLNLRRGMTEQYNVYTINHLIEALSKKYLLSNKHPSALVSL